MSSQPTARLPSGNGVVAKGYESWDFVVPPRTDLTECYSVPVVRRRHAAVVHLVTVTNLRVAASHLGSQPVPFPVDGPKVSKMVDRNDSRGSALPDVGACVPSVSAPSAMVDLVHRLLSLFGSGERPKILGTAPDLSAASPCPTQHPHTATTRKAEANGFLDFLGQEPKSGSPPELITGSIRLLDVASNGGTAAPPQLDGIARREIEAGLGPGDFRHADKDGGFVFCFSDPDLDKAQTKTAAISERIRTRVAAELPDIAYRFTIQPSVARIDRRLIIGSEMPPLEALISAIDRIRNEQQDEWQASHLNAIRVSRLLFQPAWSRYKPAPTLNRCFMNCNGLRSGFKAPSAQLLGRFDTYVLTKAVEHLHSSFRNSLRKPQLLVPVHYLALEYRGSRQELVALYERLPYEYAQLLFFEVQLPAASEVPLRLRQTLNSVAPLLRRLVLQVPDFDRRLIEGVSTALVGVSCSLADADGASSELQPRLRQFAELASIRQLLSFATDANCMGSANAGREAGVDYLIGNGVYPTQDTPVLSVRVPVPVYGRPDPRKPSPWFG